MSSNDSSPIYETSAIRVFVLLFSFSIFSDRRSLKKENENNSMEILMQKFDHKRLIYGTIGTKKQVLVSRVYAPSGFEPLKFYCP